MHAERECIVNGTFVGIRSFRATLTFTITLLPFSYLSVYFFSWGKVDLWPPRRLLEISNGRNDRNVDCGSADEPGANSTFTNVYFYALILFPSAMYRLLLFTTDVPSLYLQCCMVKFSNQSSQLSIIIYNI